MPVYNAEKTVEQAIRSVMGQTFTDFELIVIDDGSKDKSWSIMQSLAQKDPRIRVFQNEVNLGIMKTLNRAHSMTNASLLAQLDSDDEMKPTRLEKQVAYLSVHLDVAVVGSWYSMMGRTEAHDRVLKLPTTPEEVLASMAIENPLCHSSVMMRKEVFQQVGGYRPEFRNTEDYDLFLRISKLYKIANIPEVLVRNRLSLGGQSIGKHKQMILFFQLAQASHQYPEKSLEELKKELEAKLDTAIEPNYLRKFYWTLTKTLIVLGLYPDAFSAFISLLKVIYKNDSK